jgi:hypothetical protein
MVSKRCTPMPKRRGRVESNKNPSEYLHRECFAIRARAGYCLRSQQATKAKLQESPMLLPIAEKNALGPTIELSGRTGTVEGRACCAC